MARISLGARDGRRVGKKVRARSEADARNQLERLRRAYLGDVDVSNQTLDEYLADWLDSHGPSVRESTRVSYAGHIQNHISPLLGGITVARLRPSDVRRLVADRLAAGLSPSTVRRIHSTLHAALAQIQRAPVEAMSEDVAERITEATRDTFIGPLVELLLGSGMRLGEALGLDQADLHLDDSFVVVRRSKTRVRAVPISDDAVDALRRQLASAPRRGPSEPVFFAPRTHGRLTTATVSHAFPKMLTVAGLPRLTPHGLRHGAATLMVAKGVQFPLTNESHRLSLCLRQYRHRVTDRVTVQQVMASD
jgi:integrase